MCEILRPILGNPVSPPPAYNPAWRELLAHSSSVTPPQQEHVELDVLPEVETRGPAHNQNEEEATRLLEDIIVRTPAEGGE